MKNKSIIAVIAFLLFTSVFVKAEPAQSFDGITNAIRSGNASALAANFQGNVEVTIKDASGSYSKTQAEVVLKNFFAQHTPKSFSIAHEGTSPEGSNKYIIGNLSTSAGNYRVYVYAKITGGSLAIQEVRFEEQ
ncbi:MAG: DUF4783 domain-containing protein [Chitinophagales bacterium]